MANRKVSSQQRSHVRAWKKSSLTARQYAKQEGISHWSLYPWATSLNRQATNDGALWNATFVSLFASCQHMGIEPWAYLRAILCLLPDWPRSRVLELSPKFWKQTCQQAETQQILACNVFRGATPVPR